LLEYPTRHGQGADEERNRAQKKAEHSAYANAWCAISLIVIHSHQRSIASRAKLSMNTSSEAIALAPADANGHRIRLRFRWLPSLQILLARATFRRRILPMTKRALFAVAGFFGLCLSLSAQQMQSPEQLLFDGGNLTRPFLSLADQDRFFFATSFGAMHATSNFLPTFSPAGPRSVLSPILADRENPFDDAVEIRSTDRIHASGEVGFLYGKSGGKYGTEVFQTYIIGTVGNDKFSITAGVLHQESSGRVPRWGR
jgi:hypothetical protein